MKTSAYLPEPMPDQRKMVREKLRGGERVTATPNDRMKDIPGMMEETAAAPMGEIFPGKSVSSGKEGTNNNPAKVRICVGCPIRWVPLKMNFCGRAGKTSIPFVGLKLPLSREIYASSGRGLPYLPRPEKGTLQRERLSVRIENNLGSK